MIKESHALLLEMNQKEMEKMAGVMHQLNSSFNIPGMEDVNLSLKDLISKARREIAANNWTTGKSVKQLVAFYNLLDNLKNTWPKIKALFDDGEFSEQDKQDLQKLLTAATKDNVFQSLAKAFKLSTPHALGLDPNSVVTAIMAAAEQEGGIEAVSNLFQRSSKLPGVAKDGSPNLSNSPGKASKGDVVQDVQSDQKDKTKAAANPELDSNAIAGDIAKKINPKGDAEYLKKVADSLDIIKRAGYDVVPKK